MVSPVSNRLVEAVVVDFESESEPWVEYRLSDGSVFKIRFTPVSFVRLDGEYDSKGDPVYTVQLNTVMRIVSSKLHGEPTLMQKESKKSEKGGTGYA